MDNNFNNFDNNNNNFNYRDNNLFNNDNWNNNLSGDLDNELNNDYFFYLIYYFVRGIINRYAETRYYIYYRVGIFYSNINLKNKFCLSYRRIYLCRLFFNLEGDEFDRCDLYRFDDSSSSPSPSPPRLDP